MSAIEQSIQFQQHSASRRTSPLVDIVVPARDAEATIVETLASVRGQTYRNWRAVVVNDGSTDATEDIVRAAAGEDTRIAMIQVQAGSAGAARNAGIEAGDGEWILFLDADDLIDATMLDVMVAAATARSDTDAVHCGWRYTEERGEEIVSARCGAQGDLFPILACRPAFAIHACLVRRTAVDRAGLFDPSLKTCEDTDFWQRIARLGARFVSVPHTLVTYRLRAGQTWFDPRQILDDSLVVLGRTHAPDPRVREPAAKYAAGAPREGFGNAVYHAGLFACALAIAKKEPVIPVLDAVSKALETAGIPTAAGLDPEHCVDSLIAAIPLCLRLPQSNWPELWERYGGAIDQSIGLLAERTGDIDLHPAVMAGIQVRAAEHVDRGRLGTVIVTIVSVDEPLQELEAKGATTLIAHCTYGGERLGSVRLPVIDGRVGTAVLADAIASRFAWALLGRFFTAHVYPTLRVDPQGDHTSIWRGERLVDTLVGSVTPDAGDFHDRAGWTVFLQEVWGLRTWTAGEFYDDSPAEPLDGVQGQTIHVALGAPPPDFEGLSEGVTLSLNAGGVPVAHVSLGTSDGTVSSVQIVRTLTLATGFGLCQTAVREALIGRPLADPASLAERMAAKARSRSRTSFSSARHGMDVASWEALAAELAGGDEAIVLARWDSHPAFGVHPQRAALPVSVRPLLGGAAEAAAVAFTTGVPCPDTLPRLMYAPEIGGRSTGRRTKRADKSPGADASSVVSVRHHFESLFAKAANPWDYTTAYEQTKYEQTLSLIPLRSGTRALELACAEGHFTAQLAPKVASLTAVDISQTALERTQERCANMPNVSYRRLDIANDAIEGEFDAITCCEMLYYLPDIETLNRVALKIANALAPNGVAVLAHANIVVDDPQNTGFDWLAPFGGKVIGETFAGCEALTFEHELRTRLYRIQVFRKRPAGSAGPRSVSPERITEAPYIDPEPEVYRQILWNGGSVRQAQAAPMETKSLPILMYHSVNRGGPMELAQFRVSTEDFERQLEYLRDAGFRSASFEEWRSARRAKRPLPGHRVLLTFDDGYRDFAEFGWPLLKKYGFAATVFVPTDHVGGTARWDERFWTVQPLLDWNEIKSLHAEGVEFGSHSASHRSLTALDNDALAQELMRSRLTLESQIGEPVSTLCYPYGRFSPTVAHLARASGYAEAVSVMAGCSRLDDDDMALRRVEVDGRGTFKDFVASLTPSY